MVYGLNYQGSKNKIADFVMSHLPTAATFVDMFGGGGAITHAALHSGKYKEFVFNDLNPLCQCFVRAARGEYDDERLQRFIDREEFKKTYTTNEIAASCYSFGGKGNIYIYAKEIEPFKLALHKARVFGDFSDLKTMGCPSASRKWIYNNLESVKHAYTEWYLSEVMHTDLHFDDFKGKLQKQIAERSEELRLYLVDAFKKSGLKTQREVGLRLGNNMERHYFGKSQWQFPTAEAYAKMQTFMPLPREYETLFGLDGDSGADIRSLISLEGLCSFYSLEHYQNITRLRGLRNLRGINRLQCLCGSYADITPPPDAVIYCDPPYANTEAYAAVGDFDHGAFYEWALKQRGLVIISEYDMPPDFVSVAQTRTVCTLAANCNGKATVEKLFVPKHQLTEYKSRMGYLF